MAKKTRALGLKVILMGDVGADGDMGTDLEEYVGNTVRGTAALVSTPLEETEVLEEETDDAIESTITGGGRFEFRFSSYNVDQAVLKRTFGGTINATDGMWEAPDVWPTIYQSIKSEARNGYQIEAARVKISPDLNLTMQAASPGQVNFVGKIMKPEKEGVAKLRMGKPTTP